MNSNKYISPCTGFKGLQPLVAAKLSDSGCQLIPQNVSLAKSKYLTARWQPLLSTPAFPEYPPGHSVQSAAAALVLTETFGDDYSFTDYTHEGHALGVRTFASFNQAAQEAALSRFYGGNHFRAAIENGLVQGHYIGETVLGLEFR